MDFEFHLDETKRQEIGKGLNQVFADTFVLYLKTHYFHWNVTGPTFHSLHALFEEQYQELFEAVDVVAERIRALGYRAPGTLLEIQTLSSLTETSAVPGHQEMLEQLAYDHYMIGKGIVEVIGLAERHGDQGTVDVLTPRLAIHEKACWMLRSHLESSEEVRTAERLTRAVS